MQKADNSQSVCCLFSIINHCVNTDICFELTPLGCRCRTSAQFVYLVTITGSLFVPQWELIRDVRGARCYKSRCKGQPRRFVCPGLRWESEWTATRLSTVALGPVCQDKQWSVTYFLMYCRHLFTVGPNRVYDLDLKINHNRTEMDLFLFILSLNIMWQSLCKRWDISVLVVSWLLCTSSQEIIRLTIILFYYRVVLHTEKKSLCQFFSLPVCSRQLHCCSTLLMEKFSVCTQKFNVKDKYGGQEVQNATAEEKTQHIKQDIFEASLIYWSDGGKTRPFSQMWLEPHSRVRRSDFSAPEPVSIGPLYSVAVALARSRHRAKSVIPQAESPSGGLISVAYPTVAGCHEHMPFPYLPVLPDKRVLRGIWHTG